MKWLLSFFSALWEFRLVFSHLVRQYVSLRYRRTALGFLWTLINPLLTMTVTAVVFALMMRMPLRSFAIFLFSGLIPWTLFANCLMQGGQTLLENEALIKKIYVPRQTLVMARCTSLLIDAVLSFACLFVIALALGAHLGAPLLVLPIAFLLTFVFSCGLAVVMSITSVFLRDTQQIMSIVLQAGYFLTPIIYPITIVPEQYRPLMKLNPMYHFVELFRLPIFEGTVPSMQTFAIAAGCALVSALIGITVFTNYDKEVIFRL
jgi:ABC-type polysaccharide/polyol phosphate export permease